MWVQLPSNTYAPMPWDALFSGGQAGFIFLPVPDSHFPMFVESTGVTEADSHNTPVGFITGRRHGGLGKLGPQLIGNSDFTANIDGWSKRAATVGTESWHNGALRWQRHASTTGLSTGVSTPVTVPTVPGSYLFLTRMRKVSGTTVIFSELRDGDGGGGTQVGQNEPTLTTETDWVDTRGIHYLTAATRYPTLRLGSGPSGLGEIAELDDAQLYHLPGHHPTQATTAARPLLQTEGGRWHWLFDGSDDHLSVPGFSLSQPATYFVVASVAGTTGQHNLLTGMGLSNQHLVGIDSAGVFMWAGSDIGSGTVALPAQKVLITAIFNGANSVLRVNGVTVATGNVGNQNMTAGLRIGSAWNALANFLNGRIWALVGRAGNLLTQSAPLLARTETALMRLTGVA